MPTIKTTNEVTGTGTIKQARVESPKASCDHITEELRSVDYTDSLDDSPTSAKLQEVNGNELTNGNLAHMKIGSSSIRKRKIENVTEDGFGDENWVMGDQK
jgi:hypothetical protein